MMMTMIIINRELCDAASSAMCLVAQVVESTTDCSASCLVYTCIVWWFCCFKLCSILVMLSQC